MKGIKRAYTHPGFKHEFPDAFHVPSRIEIRRELVEVNFNVYASKDALESGASPVGSYQSRLETIEQEVENIQAHLLKMLGRVDTVESKRIEP